MESNKDLNEIYDILEDFEFKMHMIEEFQGDLFEKSFQQIKEILQSNGIKESVLSLPKK